MWLDNTGAYHLVNLARFIEQRELVRRLKEGSPSIDVRKFPEACRDFGVHPIFATNHFCNVSRWQDNVTKSRQPILARVDLSLSEKIMNAVGFRLLPHTLLWKYEIGPLKMDWLDSQFDDVLKASKVHDLRNGAGYASMDAETWVDTMGEICRYTPLISEMLNRQESLEQVTTFVQSIVPKTATASDGKPANPQFDAFQGVLDLALVPSCEYLLDADDWVWTNKEQLNGGSSKALRFFNPYADDQAALLEVVDHLASSLGLSMIDTEHAACEYRKFVEIRAGQRAPKGRAYRQMTQGEWDDAFRGVA